MGTYLSTPKTDKVSDDGENEDLRFGSSAMQGWRQSMEDAHTAILDVDKDTSIFGVYDGHGGKVVSKFCAKYLHKEVLKSEAYQSGDLGKALEYAFLRMDEMMKGERGWRELQILGDKGRRFSGMWDGPSTGSTRDDPASPISSTNGIFIESSDEDWTQEEGTHSTFSGPTAGSTAVVAVIRGNQLVVANAGDSRCIMSRHGKALELSLDHKPELEVERGRILFAGGFVHAGRVNGSLNLTRAIGDVKFKYQTDLPPEKQIVTCFPDVRQVELGTGDEFLVLACDGIWDVMSSQGVVDFVHQRLPNAKSISSLCEELLDYCLSPSTRQQEGCDNMSVIIVQLKKFQIETPTTNESS
ncbi:unnamed protein product [Sphagnum balticum]